jgi:hypothetical protein
LGAITLSVGDIAGAAALNGDATQNFNVKNATGTQHALPLAQADARYAPIGGGGGGVSSVGLALPVDFTVTGSPVTTAGTLTASWASRTASTFLAAPTGAAGTPVFRPIAAADVPTLNQNTTGTAAGLSATLPIASGGTGQVSAQTAINALTAVAAATNEYVLTKDTATGNALWKVVTGGGGGSFIAAGTGAVTRTTQNKDRDIVSVMDYGAVGNGSTDDSMAFQLAINALPATGGKILVPDASYLLNTEPNIGTKSIYWDIGTGCLFSGTGTTLGKFPYVKTVGGQKSVGPLIISQSLVNVGTTNGGIAAFQIDMLQPDTYGSGNSLAAYFGAKTNNANASGNTWALNTVINVGSAAQGTHQCIEVDVDCYSSAALVKGISISGLGSANPDVALEIVRVPGTNWDRGIDILYATMGIQIRNTCSGGISINAPTQTLDTPIGAKQHKTGGDTIVLQRFNDTTTGNFIRGVDSTNSTNVFGIDGLGNFTTAGYVYSYGNVTAVGAVAGASHVITGGAYFVPAGQICLGNTITSAVGSASGNYWAIIVGGTVYKIPLFNA